MILDVADRSNPRRRRTGRLHRGGGRAIRPARPGRRSAGDRRACGPHDHGLGQRQDHGRARRGADLPRRDGHQADGQGRPAGRCAGDDGHHRRGQGPRRRRGRHPDDQRQPQPAVRQRLGAEGRRLPDQRADRGHGPGPGQGRRRGRRRDRRGRHQRQRHLVRAGRPGQGHERRARRRRRRRPDERAGDGERRQRVARCRASRSPTRPSPRRSTTGTAGSREPPRSRMSRHPSSRAPRT